MMKFLVEFREMVGAFWLCLASVTGFVSGPVEGAFSSGEVKSSFSNPMESSFESML